MGIHVIWSGQVTYVVKTGNNTVRRIFGENLNNNFANLELHSSHKRLLNQIIFLWGSFTDYREDESPCEQQSRA